MVLSWWDGTLTPSSAVATTKVSTNVNDDDEPNGCVQKNQQLVIIEKEKLCTITGNFEIDSIFQ